MLSLGQLYTDDTNDNTNNDDTPQTNHDCIGSLACMQNEPKKPRRFLNRIVTYSELNLNQIRIFVIFADYIFFTINVSVV